MTIFNDRNEAFKAVMILAESFDLLHGTCFCKSDLQYDIKEMDNIFDEAEKWYKTCKYRMGFRDGGIVSPESLDNWNDILLYVEVEFTGFKNYIVNVTKEA